MPYISVIIVNYKVGDYLHQCLLSIEKASAMYDTEIFVADNASNDGSVEFLRQHHPQVTFIENDQNVGFSVANNMAIRQSKGKYVLVINPDTFVAEDMVTRCAEFMETHPDAGAVGVSMYDATGRYAPESKRAVPKPMTAFYKLMGLCKRFPKNRVFGRYYLGYLDKDQPAEIEILSGACMFIRREALSKVGLFDEDYFMYGEDIDLSYRILRGGYRNYYLPAEIVHYKGESTHKNSFSYVNNFNMSMIIFFKKHFGFYSWFLEVPILVAVYLKAALGFIKVALKKLIVKEKPIDEQRKADRFLVVTPDPDHEPAITLLRQHGFHPDILVADEQVREHGHRSADGRHRHYNFVAYSAQHFSYKEIISYFKDDNDPSHQPKMAVYQPSVNRLITPYYIL